MAMDFFILETDKYNPQYNLPLIDLTGTRDVKFSDIGLGYTSTSFLQQTINKQGSTDAEGMPWLGDEANTAPGASLDSRRVTNEVRSIGYTVKIQGLEEQRAMLTSIDLVQSKMLALQQAHQINLDKYIYLGDSSVNVTGLLNRTDVATGNAPFGDWLNASPDEIIYDVTEILTALNENAGYAVNASAILLPYTLWYYIYSTPRSSLSDKTIMQFILQNNTSAANGISLNIYPVKWLIDQGAGDTQRS